MDQEIKKSNKWNNEYRSKTMIEGYMDKMMKTLTVLHPELKPSEINSMLLDMCKQKYSPVPVVLSPADGGNALKMDVNTFDRKLVDSHPIISGSGTLYYRQDQVENDRAKMLEAFGKNRKKAKAEMFKHINDEDQSIKKSFDDQQKTWKIMMNSYYGVLNERHSQFYDSHSGKSVTTSSQDIITTSINLSEKFLGNNIFFNNLEEILNYIDNIIYEKRDHDVKNMISYKEDEADSYSKEGLYNYLTGFLIDNVELSNEEESILKRYIDRMPENIRRRIFYKNNLLEFLDNTDIIEKYFSKILGRTDFLDPNEAPDDILPVLKDTWKILRDRVFYNYQDFNRFRNASQMKRNVILLTDTDSTFVYLDGIISKFEELYPDKVNADDVDSVICTANIIMYSIQEATAEALYKLQKESNIPDKYDKIMSMKNEFLSLKIMLTDNKKQYAQIIALQEGNKLDTPEMDLKGLSIKKVSTNKNVANTFTNILHKDILEDNNISHSKIIHKYKDLENSIYQSLKKGELEYLIPAKVNTADSYVNAYRIMAFKATVVWNELFPNKVIVPPTKMQVVKVNIPTFQTVADKLDPNSHEYKVFQKLFQNKDLVGTTGINAIAIGNEEREIPEVIRMFMDADTMINDHMKTGIILLESIGMKILKTSSVQIPTNIIKI